MPSDRRVLTTPVSRHSCERRRAPPNPAATTNPLAARRKQRTERLAVSRAMQNSVDSLVDKKEIARRYGVCLRTVTEWMRKRVIPYVKVSAKIVRFDSEKCDIALERFEVKSICDKEIRAELAARRTRGSVPPIT